MDSKQTSSPIATNFWVPFAIASGIIIALFIIYYEWFADAKNGPLGDSFGILTSLFTGLAFAGVIATLWVQRQDIKVTQEEMRKSVEAQQSMAEKMEKELSYAKISNNLELLNKYISMVDPEGKQPLGYVARTIVAKLTEELVQEPTFLFAITPRIDISVRRSATSSTQSTHEFNLGFNYSTIPCTILSLTFDVEPVNPTQLHSFIGKSITTLPFAIRANIQFRQEIKQIHVLLRDNVLSKTWYASFEVEHSSASKSKITNHLIIPAAERNNDDDLIDTIQ